ncbi:MAG TPA: hypothetical protein VIJ94_20200 [Caulobacteraceae bacterium]
MSDRVLFSLVGLVSLMMIGLAMVWPQGLGARSPGPFGHTPVQQTAAARAARARAASPPPVLGMAPAATPAPEAAP